MRVMVRFTVPTEEGNEGLESGRIPKSLGMIMEELKPEAAYFFLDGGERGGLMVVNIEQGHEIAEVVERFFFGVSANVETTPVMTAEDLQKAFPAIEQIAKRFS